MFRRRPLLSGLAIAGFALGGTLGAAGCGGDDGAAPPSTTTAASTTAAASTTTTTAGASTTAAASTTTARPAPYAPVDPPSVPERTPAIPADNDLADGRYLGVAMTGEAPGVVMELLELRTGAACEAWAVATGGECTNDYVVITDVQAYRPVPDGVPVSVAAPDGPGRSYAIDTAELLSLVRGNAPSADAPAGYAYVAFPFIVTVRDGEVAALEQWWVP